MKIRRKLSVKLMISYLVIVIMSVTMLYVTTVIISTKSFEKQAIEHNMTMIRRIRDAYEEKCRNLKNAIANLYTTSLTSDVKSDIWKLLLEESEQIRIYDYMQYRSTLISYLRENCLTIDNDLMFASVIDLDANKVFTDSKVSFYLDDMVQSEVLRDAERTDQFNQKRIHFVETMEGAYDKIALMYYQIVDPQEYKRVIGYMVFGFAPEAMENTYNSYQDSKLGDIMIISDSGEFIFDSDESYAYPEGIGFSDIQEVREGNRRFEDQVVNVVYEPDYGFYVISIIDPNDLDTLNTPIKTVAYIGGILFVAFAVLFSMITSNNLTKRINQVQKAMLLVQEGDLSSRANISGNDEIREIGDRFDLMCESLESYIQREYIYQMRQKEAQIFALQSQVNPHFLYNALEAIRMKAVMANDVDVSKMVLSLANIFRNNIKSDMVISLRQEINNCASFLELYNIRYDYGIELICTFDEQVSRAGIIRHLIQPILENAIVHGFDLNRQDNVIEIDGRIEGEYLVLHLQDNGKGIDDTRLEELRMNIQNTGRSTFSLESNSVGLVNVHERIQLAFGKECGLEIISEKGRGTTVTIRILYKTIEELRKDVQRTGS